MTKKRLPPDQDQRQRILEDLDSCLLVEAAAGTGKTTSLVGRMVELMRQGRCLPGTLAAVTFTRKAAAELRSRFQLALERAVSEATGVEQERLTAALEQVDRCFVGTIHAFCGRLLRERPIEAGIDLAFEEMDDQVDGQLRTEAWKQYVAEQFAADSPVLQALADLGLEINQLPESFLTFADYPDVDEWPACDIDLGDLTSVAAQLQHYAAHMSRLVPAFPVERGNDQLMAKYERLARLVPKRNLTRAAELLELLELFEPHHGAIQKHWPEGKKQGKEECQRWEGFAEATARPLLKRWREKRYFTVIQVLQAAVQVYDRMRAARGRLNYQDLLICAGRLLRDKPQIRRYFRQRFTHLLVDEFQDTDPVQAEVMMLLTADDPAETAWRRCRPVPGALFVVGDPKQSIYRFRRADIVTYSQVKDVIVASGGGVVHLTANFRSTSNIVAWCNTIFDATFPEVADKYSPARSSLLVAREDGCPGKLAEIQALRIPEEHCSKAAASAYDARRIAHFIHDALRRKLTVPRTAAELKAGMSAQVQEDDFLIVTWNKKVLAQYAAELQLLGIPHQVTGGSALGQVSELRLLADCLRALAEPDNPVNLVAVLRGELFGFSDVDLYRFRRAQGRFHFRSSVPEGLPPEVKRQFQDAFGRLQKHAKWLRQLPPVAAVERIAADLGLPMRSLMSAGGNERAGCLAKAIELLRIEQFDYPSTADVARRLDELINEEIDFDGLPVRAQDRPAVRLMNLHKVKGLESTVVFLAHPAGKWDPPVTLHVDRSADRVRGYMAVYAPSNNYHPPLLACPQGWDTYAAEEKRFGQAEHQRLLYVAATRVRAHLVISQKEKDNHTNHWGFFGGHLSAKELSTTPSQTVSAARDAVRISESDVIQAGVEVSRRLQLATTATYAAGAAKELSIARSPRSDWQATGEHGTEWGTAIHVLLEAAMRDGCVRLADLAYSVFTELGLDPAAIPQAIETVNSVMRSSVWQRAQRAAQCLTEVPFTYCMTETDGGNQPPTVLRGVIDLVFREAAGWVIVDYKTDMVSRESLRHLVDHYRGQLQTYAQSWEQVVGAPVKEQGLFFTRIKEYVPIT